MCTRRCDIKVKMDGLFVLVNDTIDKSLRWKQYRMQIGGLKFVTRPDNTHAKFKIILSSFPNLLTCSFLIQHQQLQPAGIN